MEYGESAENQTMMTYQDYQYGGKEFDRKFEINLYDFHARPYDATRAQWTSPDPLAEKYYSISPYAYCANNPMRYIDPDGMDIWNLNTDGYFTRIEDKTQDRFNIVDNKGKILQDKDGNDRSKSFKYGTVQNVTEKNVKVNGEAKTLTLFDIKGDDNAESLFKFIANPGETTNVEWSHDKVGSEKSEKNIVSTIHDKSHTVGGYYLTKNGYTIKEDIHSHPNNPEPSPADMDVAKYIHKKNPNAKLNIYKVSNGYILYNENGIINPNKKEE